MNEYAKKDGMSLNSIIIDVTREYVMRKKYSIDYDNIANLLFNKLNSDKKIIIKK